MGTPWTALERSLWQTIKTEKAQQQWERVRLHEQELRRFRDPDSLVAHFRDKHADLDEKDAIYRMLVLSVQTESDCSDLAESLLWLGLWPGLSGSFRRHRTGFAYSPAELVAEISWIFTDMVHRIDLSRVNRVAATLVLNVRRDLTQDIERHDRIRNEQVDWEPYQERLSDESLPGLDDRELEVDANDPEALFEWLRSIVGKDAPLVLGAAICGIAQRELADQLDIGYGATRKRLQRAYKKLRDYLSRSHASRRVSV